MKSVYSKNFLFHLLSQFRKRAWLIHLQRPGGSHQLGWEKRCDESFQVQAEEPPGYQLTHKWSTECWLLIRDKNALMKMLLLCPFNKQRLLNSFHVFIHDGYCLPILIRLIHQDCVTYKGNFHFLLS